MSASVKFLIGLAAVLTMGWIYHGPLGNGAAYVDGLEAGARRAVASTGLPGISVTLGHDPLSRRATLSGPANDFQREGQGELKGLNDLVGEIEGVSGVHWADEGGGAGGIPLLVETLLSLLLPYLVGIGFGWLVFGREKKEGFL